MVRQAHTNGIPFALSLVKGLLGLAGLNLMRRSRDDVRMHSAVSRTQAKIIYTELRQNSFCHFSKRSTGFACSVNSRAILVNARTTPTAKPPSDFSNRPLLIAFRNASARIRS